VTRNEAIQAEARNYVACARSLVPRNSSSSYVTIFAEPWNHRESTVNGMLFNPNTVKFAYSCGVCFPEERNADRNRQTLGSEENFQRCGSDLSAQRI